MITTYIDENGNLQFADQYLVNEENADKTQDHNLKVILEKLTKTQNKDERKT